MKVLQAFQHYHVRLPFRYLACVLITAVWESAFFWVLELSHHVLFAPNVFFLVGFASAGSLTRILPHGPFGCSFRHCVFHIIFIAYLFRCYAASLCSHNLKLWA